MAGEKRGSLVDKIATIFAGFFFVLTLLRSHYGMNRPSVVCNVVAPYSESYFSAIFLQQPIA